MGKHSAETKPQKPDLLQPVSLSRPQSDRTVLQQDQAMSACCRARYDKLAANYLAFVKLASIRIWLRANESRPWFNRPHGRQPPSPHHRAIDDVLDLLTVVLSQFAGSRGSDHDDEPLLRIAEELRAVGAIPGELAGIAGNRGQTLAGADRNPEAETKTGAMRFDIGDVVLD